MTDACFGEANQTALDIDKFHEQNNRLKGPLHGIPVSFKDQFHVKGTETTMGYVSWIGTFEGMSGTGKDKSVDSRLVEQVRNLGAIPVALVRYT